MLSSCNSDDFKLSELKSEKLKFSDLPNEVKEFLLQPPESDPFNPSSLIFITSVEAERYKLEVVKTKVGPWTDYLKLIDTKNKVSYRIKQGTPSPFFIYRNIVYIPNRYNIVVVNKNLEEVEFTCYTLK